MILFAQLLLAFLAAALLTSRSEAAEIVLPRQVAMINHAIEQGWNDYEIRPAPDVDDSTWCRRVYLDVIGRIPSGKRTA